MRKQEDIQGKMLDIINTIKTINRVHTTELYYKLNQYISYRKKIKKVTRMKDIAHEVGMSRQSLARVLAWKYANTKTMKLVDDNKITMPFVLRILNNTKGKKQDFYIEKVIKNNLNYDTIDIMLKNNTELSSKDEEAISRQNYRGCNKRIETLQKDLLGFNALNEEYREKLKSKLIRLNRSINIILKC